VCSKVTKKKNDRTAELSGEEIAEGRNPAQLFKFIDLFSSRLPLRSWNRFSHGENSVNSTCKKAHRENARVFSELLPTMPDISGLKFYVGRGPPLASRKRRKIKPVGVNIYSSLEHLKLAGELLHRIESPEFNFPCNFYQPAPTLLFPLLRASLVRQSSVTSRYNRQFFNRYYHQSGKTISVLSDIVSIVAWKKNAANRKIINGITY